MPNDSAVKLADKIANAYAIRVEGYDAVHGSHYDVLPDEDQALIAAALRLNPSAQSAPAAWRVKNDFDHWIVTTDKALADTWRDTEKFEVQPLFLGLADASPVASQESNT